MNILLEDKMIRKSFLIFILFLIFVFLWAEREIIIQNFESGSIILDSYPDEDNDPDGWEIDSLNTYDGSTYCLKLFGNTWKTASIFPFQLNQNTVWRIMINVQYRGEIQGIGVGDGSNTLFYSLYGSEIVSIDEWVTANQGAFPQNEWQEIFLPIGNDWMSRFDSLSMVTQLVFVNDRDEDNNAVFGCIIDGASGASVTGVHIERIAIGVFFNNAGINNQIRKYLR